MDDTTTPDEKPLHDDTDDAFPQTIDDAEPPVRSSRAELLALVDNHDRATAERLAAHHALVSTDRRRDGRITSQADHEQQGLPAVSATWLSATGILDSIPVMDLLEDGTVRDGIESECPLRTGRDR